MTTLRDLLNDFANEIVKSIDRPDIVANPRYKEERERVVDEYIETIKGRIVG